MELIIIVEITDEHTQSALEEINLPTYCKIILIRVSILLQKDAPFARIKNRRTIKS